MIDAAARAGAHDVVELAMLLGVRVPRLAGSDRLAPVAPAVG
jgi:DNA polymerase-3 subunit epsilon